MKNNALKLISLALVLPMMTACPKPKKPVVVVPDWEDEIQEAMELYVGEVLPYAELDEETLTYGYNDSTAVFYVYDDNEVKVLENYAELLVSAGFEETENQDYFGDTYISYDKTNEVGDISVTFGFDEGDDETLPGNFINVAVPEYVTEDLLAEWGYEKQQGWPAQLVADTLEGSGVTISPVNANGEWWTASELAHDDEYGDWYCAYLATKGDFTEEMDAALLAAGCAYDDYWGGYGDATEASDFFITVVKIRDFTIVNIEGPTLVPVPTLPDISEESENLDGSITVTYTFANALVEGTSYEETFESESCNLTVGKGGNTNNAPTYYTSGASLRCYYKNTLVLEAAQGYEIQSVNLTVGFVKNLTINDVSASAGTVSASGTVPGATVAVSGVNAGSLTITVGANATKGNVGFSAIEVVLAAVR